MRLVVVVGVDGLLDAVLDELLKRALLADELDEFGDATTAAQYDQLFLLEKELFDGAALLLIEQLVDLHVASKTSNEGGWLVNELRSLG